MIPARSGSMGIRDKNIVEIEGFPLLAYSIAAASLCRVIDRVIVSTNSERYAKIAKSFGAEIPFLRPESISQGDSTDIEYLRHGLQELIKMDGYAPEFVVLLRPTTPVRNPQIIARAVEKIYGKEEISAVVSVSLSAVCPYKWMQIKENGYLAPLFPHMKSDEVNLPRQSFPDTYIPNGYVDVIKSENVLLHNYVYGEKAVPYPIEGNTVDIDSIDDLSTICKGVIRESELFHYLKLL